MNSDIDLALDVMLDRVAALRGTEKLSVWQAGLITRLIDQKNTGEVAEIPARARRVLIAIYNEHFAAGAQQ